MDAACRSISGTKVAKAGESASGHDMPWDDLILVGIIARPHGHRGQVIVNPHTDFVEDRFAEGQQLECRTTDGRRRQLQVTASRVQQGRPIVTFGGVASMTEAEALAGAELRVAIDDLVPLAPGQYFHHQLVGCDVETDTHQWLGKVLTIDGGIGQSRIVVGGGRRPYEIPLVSALCDIDISARRITVRPPEGLLDL